MNNFTKNNLKIATMGLVVLVILALSLFCHWARFSLIIPLLLLTVGIHLAYFQKASLRLFLNLGLLLASILLTAYYMTELNSVSKLLVPVASVAMLTVVLFKDLQLSFLMAFVSSVLVSLIMGRDFNLMLIYFLGSLIGTYSLMNARHRSHLMNAGFYVGFIQAVGAVLLFTDLIPASPQQFALRFVLPLFLNGLIAASVVLMFSKVFEWLFNGVTDYTLLELSDFNHPLLRRMILEAPGTYHHCLVVSNLAESAADAIGANSLLARVGAYYHDIGKLEKPEYFTENQMNCGNKHDLLEPHMSRLVILNHVKDGVELARKYRLNPVIVDFITQHHGTALIHYFYQRALEEGTVEEVGEENFRYPGPRPQSKEAAVVLLADSVEGATRSLEEPTPVRLDDLVRKVINNKFIDGQLDQCNLTLKEIEIICSIFSRILGAMYHTRVRYSEKKNGNEHSGAKPAADLPVESSQDQEHRPKHP